MQRIHGRSPAPSSRPKVEPPVETLRRVRIPRTTPVPFKIVSPACPSPHPGPVVVEPEDGLAPGHVVVGRGDGGGGTGGEEPGEHGRVELAPGVVAAPAAAPVAAVVVGDCEGGVGARAAGTGSAQGPVKETNVQTK